VLLLCMNSVRTILKLNGSSGNANDSDAEEGTKDKKEVGLPKVAPRILSYNILELLLALPPPKSADAAPTLFAAPSGTGTSASGALKRKTRPEGCTPGEAKKASGRCWVKFLQASHPKDVFKRVLLRMESHVLKHLSSPLLLSDFLTRSYDVGGYTSVLALNGLFELITKHNLDYPQFYTKLYDVLDANVFLVRYRSRFFELLHICLVSSTKLPVYLSASFAKRLGRLSLAAPPSGALLAITLVHNMLHRHPALLPLVHRLALGIDCDGDPFVETESNPEKSNALHSSLWELQALTAHYCPAVRTLAGSFQSSFADMKVRKFNVEDFVEESYETVFETELTAKAKRVALAFDKPESLFSKDWTESNTMWSLA